MLKTDDFGYLDGKNHRFSLFLLTFFYFFITFQKKCVTFEPFISHTRTIILDNSFVTF